ncbi:MAG: calcium-binding protein [Gammaproteobacteria bacterium]|nr:calcium-binding protein [Gammaproteobacteria bacterium]
MDTLLYMGGAGTLTLNANLTLVEIVDASGATGAININASAVGTGLTISGNGSINILTGTANADELNGNAGNDIFLIASGAHHDAGETIDGGADTDVIRFISATVGDSLVLDAFTANIESVVISDKNGLASGVTNLNLDASAVVSSGLILTGNAGRNTITGTDGADTITGGLGADTLNGGDGDDLFMLTATSDFAASEIISGAIDTDTIRYSATSGTLTLTSAVTGVEIVEIATGTAALGVFTGTQAINVNASAITSNGITLTGNAGNNTLTGTGLADTVNGNGGNDTLNGGAGVDTLNGDAGTDTLNGGADADTLNGDAGNDTLKGGTGSDMLTGGADSDTFHFDTAIGTDIDTVTDFSAADDGFALDNLIFTALTDGALAGAAFESGAGLLAATGAAIRIFYDSTAGDLSYDADGNGADAAVHFATLQGTPSVTAADFLVV